MKISRGKTELFKIRFKSKVGANESSHNIRVGSKLINKIDIQVFRVGAMRESRDYEGCNYQN